MSKKRILLAHYRLPYPLYVSGADIANLTFADHLIKRGFEVQLLYTSGPEPLESMVALLEKRGIKGVLKNNQLQYQWRDSVVIVVTGHDFLTYYQNRLTTFNPDWVWHHNSLFYQFNLADLVKGTSCKHMAYIQSLEAINTLSDIKDQLDLILVISAFLQQEITVKWSRESSIVLPLPEKETFIAPYLKDRRQYITFINPIKSKGAEIVYHLAKTYPEKKFLLVLGWMGTLSQEFDFKALDNVTVHPPCMDMPYIYERTRLVLIPSLVQEGFCRIQFEAAYNHIPCIASCHGAIAEFFHGNGFCLKQFQNLEVWEKALAAFENASVYEEAVENCKVFDLTYSFDEQLNRFVTCIMGA